MKPSLI